MGKRRRRESGGGEGNWLNTYADMVTLVLTFFVLMYTMSSVDAEKWQILVEAFNRKGAETAQVVLVTEGEGNEMGTNLGESPGNTSVTTETKEELPTDFNQLYEYIKAYVEENNLTASVEMSKGDASVFIRFRDNVFFNPDSAVLQKQGLKLLEFIGDCLKNVEDEILSVRINGHTASVPGTIKTPGFDRTLSTDRANSVLIYLEETKRIEPKKLIAIGYGRNYPIVSNETEVGRRKNRRVEMMILSNDVSIHDEEDVFKLLKGDYDIELFSDPENSSGILGPPS